MENLNLKTVKLMIEQGLQEIEQKQKTIVKRNNPYQPNQESILSFMRLSKTKQEYKKCEDRLSTFEEGIDGITFDAIIPVIRDKESSSYYDLTDLVMRIMELKIINSLGSSTNFTEIKAYASAATKILYDMKYYEGDKFKEKYLGLSIYENPKNYTLADLQVLEESLTESTWEKEFVASTYFTYNEATKTFKVKKLFPSLMNQKLRQRERLAFYGSEALQILGIDQVNFSSEKQKNRGAKK